MASQAFGYLRFNSQAFPDEIWFARNLAQELQDGSVTISRHEPGAYIFLNLQGKPKARVYCRECENSGIPKEKAKFRAITRWSEGTYNDRFGHKEIAGLSPCQNPDRKVIHDVRVEPVIRLSKNDPDRCTLFNRIRRHSKMSDDAWENTLLKLESERDSPRVDSNNESALFKWKGDFPKIFREYGDHKFRVRPFIPNDYHLWKFTDDGLETLIKIPIVNKTFQVPRDGYIFLSYPNCDCGREDKGNYCGCDLRQDRKYRPIKFDGVPFPLIQFKDVNNPIRRAEFEEILEEIHGANFKPNFPESSAWIDWIPGISRNIDGVITSDRGSVDLLLQIRSRDEKTAKLTLTNFDSIQDISSRDLINLDVSDGEDTKVYSTYHDPKILKISTNRGEDYHAIRISGSGIFSVEVDGRLLISYPISNRSATRENIETLSGKDRQNVLKKVMEFDFDSVSDDYYGGDFNKKVWDFLRASQTESQQLVSDQDPFATNRTSMRLNKLRKLFPELQHLDQTIESLEEADPEPSSSIFHRLMELNRPERKDAEEFEEQLEKNPVFGGWVSPTERVVGSEEMDWGLLFNSAPVSHFVGRGIDSDEIRLLRNGLRLIKTDAAARLGIPIVDRLPAMDFVSDNPLEMLSNLFENLSDEERQDLTLTYSRLREARSIRHEHIFSGLGGGTNTMGIPKRQHLHSGPQESRWWEEDRATSIEIDGASLTLHRFSSYDDVDEEWSYQFYVIQSKGDDFMAMKVLSYPGFVQEGMPADWVHYLTSAPKSEWNMRRFTLLREVVRAFYSSSDSRDHLSRVSEIDNNDRAFIIPLLPYSVRRFFMWKTSKAIELRQFQPDLLDFIDKKTATQLWLD